MDTFALDSLISWLLVNPLVDFTSLFCPHDFEKNDSIILSYFKMNEIDKTNLAD